MAAVASLSCRATAAQVARFGESCALQPTRVPPRDQQAAPFQHRDRSATLIARVSNAVQCGRLHFGANLTSGLYGVRVSSRVAGWKTDATRVRRRTALVRAAGKDESSKDKDDVPQFKGFPPMQEKPAWYWRILACVPYILPFCEGWLYAKPALYLFPALELYEAITMPVWQIIGKLPGWFLIAYILTAYTFVVRNNRWPHFIRFHVVNGMLLEIFLQAIGILNDWLPRSIYWGTFGTHFWLFMSISYFFTVLLCILYALRGMYADVPFTSDASYMQIPYE